MYGPSNELCWIRYPVNIFREPLSIFTGKFIFVSLSVDRIISIFSLEMFSFSAACFIVSFAFSSVIYVYRFFVFNCS